MYVRSGRASARRTAARRRSSSACAIGLDAVVRREGADLAQQLQRLVGLGLVEHADGEAGMHEHVVADLGFGYEHEAGALLEACGSDGRQRAVDGGDAHGKREAHVRVLWSVSYTHLRAHETRHDLVCRL